MFQPDSLTKTNSIMRRDAEYFTDDFRKQIGKMSGRCIDIGTGAGDVTVDFILSKLSPNSTLLCSDISEEMVNYGEKTYGKNNERLRFRKLDIETPELPQDLVGQFDHLTSLYCVHWCYNTRQAFENMYSLLRPGGTAFVTFLANFGCLCIYADLQATPKYQDHIKDAHRCVPPYQKIEQPRKHLMKLLNDVGFQVKICSYRIMHYVWDTVDSATALFTTGSPFNIDDLPADIKSEYIKDVTEQILDREIVFNKDRNNKDESSVLGRYNVFILYMKKPLDE